MSEVSRPFRNRTKTTEKQEALLEQTLCQRIFTKKQAIEECQNLKFTRLNFFTWCEIERMERLPKVQQHQETRKSSTQKTKLPNRPGSVRSLNQTSSQAFLQEIPTKEKLFFEIPETLGRKKLRRRVESGPYCK